MKIKVAISVDRTKDHHKFYNSATSDEKAIKEAHHVPEERIDKSYILICI